MNNKNKKPEYTDEPRDDWQLSPDAKPLSRKQEAAMGLPSPAEFANVEWEKTVAPDRVVLQPHRGGTRPGAGRKPKHHVRMQILVPKATREKIRHIARKRGLSMSSVVAEAFKPS